VITDPQQAHSNPSGALEDYLDSVSRPELEELVALRERTAAIPFVSQMQSTPVVRQLLQLLIRSIGARRVLEVGVFTGCSTLAMAAAVPTDGRVVAIDSNEKWAAIGREFWARGGHLDRIDLRIGEASRVLDDLRSEFGPGSFDLAFVDANKDEYEEYFERALFLVRQNGLLLFDNILFGGRVHPGCTAAHIRAEVPRRPRAMQDVYVKYADGLRRFNERVACDERVELVVLPMADGVTLARKR